MKRIRRTEALCLRVIDHRESSKFVTLFTPDKGRITCVAKGARRPRSKFGAALEPFSVSAVIYYWHQAKTVYTLSDAQLVRSFPGLAQDPERFLAAERIVEFLLRSLRPEDPHPRLYRLASVYLETLETMGKQDAERTTHDARRRKHEASGVKRNASSVVPLDALVSSFLLKGASLLGFRPELRNCLGCRRPVGARGVYLFDPARGGLFCPQCRETVPSGLELSADGLATLTQLLFSPAAEIAESAPKNTQLDLVLRFVSLHLDPLLLNSFGLKWSKEKRKCPMTNGGEVIARAAAGQLLPRR